jgi:hypothetical protein
MKSIEAIYRGAQKILEKAIRDESRAQGHYLTGAMEESLDANNQKQADADVLEGTAINYTKYVNEGVRAESASFKQFPFLIRYFQLRGLPEEEAKRAAAATIRVWQKEGMPTEASSRFSKNRKRKQMIEDAIKDASNALDKYMSTSLDAAVSKEFLKEKSETI